MIKALGLSLMFIRFAGDPEDGDNRVIGILGQRDVLNWLVRSFLDATDADILDGVASILCQLL